jgi:glutathione S-transferase
MRRALTLAASEACTSFSQREDESMIELFTAATPNGWKVSIALEELGLPYGRPIALGKLEQKAAWFLKINNAIRPSSIGNGDRFQSSAILII